MNSVAETLEPQADTPELKLEGTANMAAETTEADVEYAQWMRSETARLSSFKEALSEAEIKHAQAKAAQSRAKSEVEAAQQQVNEQVDLMIQGKKPLPLWDQGSNAEPEPSVWETPLSDVTLETFPKWADAAGLSDDDVDEFTEEYRSSVATIVSEFGQNREGATLEDLYQVVCVEMGDLAKHYEESEVSHSLDEEQANLAFVLLNSLERPAVDPEAWKSVIVGEVFNGGIAKTLVEKNNINTMEDFVAAMQDKNGYDELDGIGPAKAEEIDNALAEFWAKHPQADTGD